MDPAIRKKALRGITYGIYIAGARGANAGELTAFTATWVTQASFEPPLVAMAVRGSGAPYQMIAATGVFSVNILPSGRSDLAKRFVQRIEPGKDRFEGVEFYTLGTGTPILKDALRFIECRVIDRVERGDHGLFVGEVVHAGVHAEGEPLTLKETGMSYGG